MAVASVAAAVPVVGQVVTAIKASRAARRAMREAKRNHGLPTSNQPISQSNPRARGNTPIGRQQTHINPSNNQKVTVQKSRQDQSHPNQPHVEVGKVRKDEDGFIKRDRFGRPRPDNNKSKQNVEGGFGGNAKGSDGKGIGDGNSDKR